MPCQLQVSGVPIPTATEEHEIDRQREDCGPPLTIASGIKLCVVGRAEAARLQLEVLRPEPRHAATSSTSLAAEQRARRLEAGTIPRVVDIERARPWEFSTGGRTYWYKTNVDGITRQVLGLKAYMLRGDAAAVQAACR